MYDYVEVYGVVNPGGTSIDCINYVAFQPSFYENFGNKMNIYIFSFIHLSYCNSLLWCATSNFKNQLEINALSLGFAMSTKILNMIYSKRLHANPREGATNSNWNDCWG
jgi:hypothetical protein